ncbi:MAG: hypothetical protein J6V83_05110, partial [Clostridia bacterium]|nr:hypothetical protein [Clostridia bacterium]
NNVYAKDYNVAKATIYRYNMDGADVDSYVPRSWNDDKAIEELSGDNTKAYANECEKSGDGIFGGAYKVAWNYTGRLRFIDVYKP